MKNIVIIISLLTLSLSSCKKDISFTQDHLDFSVDTVLFDTVFTTVGSTTKRLKIYNYNNQTINIDAIELMGGASSPFRINVDGEFSSYLENVEIPANDSLFSFVEVTLEVNNVSNPLVISDSIRFETNGVNQYVNLDVWGQDAYFHANEVVDGVWLNDKPHVLYGTVAVGYPGIDSNTTLTIPAATQIYCHKNSQLIVYKSSIDMQGALGSEVVFQGDRLESSYDDVSGQWWGIRLIEANYSQINYAIIKNGSVGLSVDSTQSALTLDLSNSIIDNHDFFGFNVNAGAHVNVENCLFGDAGVYSVYLFAGGEYHFNNCDIINYWAGSRAGPALAIKNYFEVEGVTYVRSIVNSELLNSVVYGSIDKELEVDSLQVGTFDMVFDYNCIKRNEPYNYPAYTNIIWANAIDNNPLFIDVSIRDFHFEASSILRDAANSLNATAFDIEGIGRAGSPDLGCYEFN